MDIDLLQLIRADIDKFYDQLKSAKSDGRLDRSEMYGLVLYARDLAVAQMAKFSQFTGPEKKAAVVSALNSLYDQYVAPLDLIPYVPESVEARTIDPLLKGFFPGLVEASVAAFKLGAV